jgi:hypothetical protein
MTIHFKQNIPDREDAIKKIFNLRCYLQEISLSSLELD